MSDGSNRLSTLQSVETVGRSDSPNVGHNSRGRWSPFVCFRYADKLDKTLLVIGGLAAIGLGLCTPLNMVVIGSGMSAAGTGDLKTFKRMIGNFVILAAVALVLGFLAVQMTELAAERQIRRIKQAYVDAALKLEIGFFDMKDAGTLASELETSCVQIREGIGMKCGQLLRSIAMFVGGYAVGLYKDWKMTLLITIGIPFIGLFCGLYMRASKRAAEKSRRQYAEASAIAEETIPAMRTVAAFGLEDVIRDRFDAILKKCEQVDLQGSHWKAMCIGLIFFFLYASYAFGWWWGGRTVRLKIIQSNGEDLTYGGKVLTTFYAVVMSAFTLAYVSPYFAALATSANAVADVHTFISCESQSTTDETPGQTPVALNGDIEFKGVRFAYPSRPERDIYQNVSFKIKAGDTVALVGPSGAGKSTVIQLIERFYDPTGGEILMDGVASTDYNLQWLRKQMALVSQEPRLFCTTIRQNIAYGKPGATEPEIIAAAKAANAHTFIMKLSDGYDTNVGQGGSLLSGGQKQRIAIARAIIRNPSILILDEATSALDNQSEKMVQQALDELVVAKKRTTIIIAHRLSTIRKVDRIIVVDDVKGRGSVVVEQGTHEELVAIEGGTYRALVNAQASQDDGSSLSGPSANMNSQARQSPAEVAKKGSLSAAAHSVVSTKGSVQGKASFRRGPISKLFYVAKADGVAIFIALLSAGLAATAEPLNAVLLSALMATFFQYDSDISVQRNADKLKDRTNKLALAYLGLSFALGLCRYAMTYTFDYSGYRTVARLRGGLFANLLFQDMELFDDPTYNTGFLSSVLSADCELARGLLGSNLSINIQNVISMAVAIGIGLAADWRLALVAVSAYFLVIPAGFMQTHFVQSTSVKMGEVAEETSPPFVLNEILTNVKVIAAFGLRPQMSQQYGEALALYYARGRRNSFVTGGACALAESLIFLANANAYGYGYHLMRTRGLQVGNMMRCLFAILIAGNGVARSAAWTTDTKKAETACENIFYLTERRPKIDARSLLGSRETVEGSIALDGICFTYPSRPDVPVLTEVSFSVQAGQTVALVGESGSGKSTVVQLLERFYEIKPIDSHRLILDDKDEQSGEAKEAEVGRDKGALFLQGRNILDINLKHLRKSIGLVEQQPVLFDVTVEENIRYGNLAATDEQVRVAAKLANAEEFILRLPEGYQTKVGKGGGLLSGGQKQRVAIARAIIRDPKVLLLDEATSALDPESEEIVQKALDDLLRKSKRTTIVIAHRLSTVRNADKIVVFAPQPGTGSKVVEEGNHEELMRLPNGVYRNLVLLAQSESVS